MIPSVDLGEFAVKRGGSVDPAKHPEETFQLFSIPAYDTGEAEITLGSQIGSSKKCVEPGDVLLSRIVPHIRRCWIVGPMTQHRQIASGEWISFRGDDFHPPYLRHFLMSDPFHSKFMQTVSGVGGSLLRARPAEVYKIKLPLPPLPEQKRIAKILDAADALRAKRRESLAQLDALLQSTFLEMFGDPVENPKGWPLISLPSLALRFCDGPFGSNLKSSHYVDNGIRVIRLQNIGVGELLDDDLAFISEEHYQSLPRNHCKPGDVVIGTLGDPNLRACVIPENLPESLNKADCLLFRPDTDRVLSSYVCWLFNCRALVDYSAGLVRGQTRGRISLGRLKTMSVPTPPLVKQMEFDQVVNQIKNHKSVLATQIEELDALFESLQQSTFAGQL